MRLAMTTAHFPRRRRGDSGFTLTELLVTLLIVTMVLLAVLGLFDMTSRTARTQTHLADMQQSQRVAQQTVVRLARMAGRGGLPTRDDTNTLPAGLALAVENNVAAGTTIAGSAAAPVLQGTDVVTVRGVFNTPLYQVDPIGTAFAYTPGNATGRLTLSFKTPTGAPQPLEAIRDAIQQVNNGVSGGTHPEALLLVSPMGQFAVVEMVPGGSFSPANGEVTTAVVEFQANGGVFTAAGGPYPSISQGGSYPTTLRTVAYAGLLEEYQLYVRDVRAVPGDPSSDLMPELVRARVYPNTDVAYARDAASLGEVIADNVLDLQVALGVDTNGDGLITEGAVGATVTPNVDEWLFNHTGDDPLDVKWNTATNALYYLRINTLVRTDRAEAYYDDDPLGVIEDKDYAQSPYIAYNAEWQRRYHRRLLRTTIDLRNL
jgi:prepilin-type N-terminal cleavage/methylation domain-containing protein